jgi:3-oxoacyl-[acyl-carrier protein] reductase
MTVAIVTGVAGGIGAALARRLAGAGHAIVAVDLAEGVHDVAATLRSDGLEAVAVQADLTNPEGRAEVMGAAGDLGPLGVLVNNAGITRDARLVKMEEEQFRSVIAVNLGAVHELTRVAVDAMVEGGSRMPLRRASSRPRWRSRSPRTSARG